MKNVFFTITLFGVCVLNTNYSLDLNELHSYFWALINIHWD